MRCSFTLIAPVAAASVLALGLWAAGPWLAHAQHISTADTDGSGVHLHASVDRIAAAPPGDRTPNVMMTFSHATQVSGDYSVTVTGAPITSGSAIAGFLLGCGISAAGGVSVGISPNQGLDASVSPSLTLNTPSATPTPTSTNPPAPGNPPTPVTPPGAGTAPSADLGPSVGGSLGMSQSLGTTIEPGQVTTATTATANLDSKTRFPYHLTFNNAALNISQCASPVAAIPFVTTTVATAQGSVQTTAYGNQFTF
ncbi:MspA family porin [Nocardia macrotermitis]|uniref:MspA protein n=1 Tax=Nocardia macrotermitis TaxID=2585198 RepID=A0A7K0D807_9NOCA|nr:MspA family porin [Nocardia macrotermitis]MQY21857.1 hypothetical protein [Nocardia macrotermitis]